MTARSRPPVSLDAEFDEGRLDVVDPAAAPEAWVEAREQQARLEAALGALPPEDAAIVRLHYLQGLSLEAVERALHLPRLTRARLAAIVDVLRRRLAGDPHRGAPRPHEAGGRA
jgi:DNA-directed RNA polymerase specialized sigma24 family protein